VHLQQTKAGSRATGGPQYYFHDLTEDVREFLRRKGARAVVLQTPYGIVETPFIAVGVTTNSIDQEKSLLDGSGMIVFSKAARQPSLLARPFGAGIHLKRGPISRESISTSSFIPMAISLFGQRRFCGGPAKECST